MDRKTRTQALAGAAAAAIAIGAGFGAGQLSSDGSTSTTTAAESCPASITSISQGGCSKDLLAPPGEPAVSEEAPAPLGALAPLAGSASSYANGRIPDSALCPITGGVGPRPGGTLLCGGPASSWNAMAVAWHKRTGYWLQTNGNASAYRTYAQQVELRNYWCGLGNCANAAVPGSSNHGWGTAVDNPSPTQTAIRTIGARFHWGIGPGSCSDASWEPWHAHYCGGYSGRDPGPYGQRGPAFKPLKRGDKGKRVRQISTRLAVLRRPTPSHPHYMAWKRRTSHFNKAVAFGVRRLQRDCHLTDDAVYGPKTDRCLDHRWAAHK